jgi:hypothetical protein
MKWLRRCFQSQGTHRCAHIEAGLIRFEVRKDHRDSHSAQNRRSLVGFPCAKIQSAWGKIVHTPAKWGATIRMSPLSSVNASA